MIPLWSGVVSLRNLQHHSSQFRRVHGKGEKRGQVAAVLTASVYSSPEAPLLSQRYFHLRLLPHCPNSSESPPIFPCSFRLDHPSFASVRPFRRAHLLRTLHILHRSLPFVTIRVSVRIGRRFTRMDWCRCVEKRY